jgi:hypothetical protein
MGVAIAKKHDGVTAAAGKTRAMVVTAEVTDGLPDQVYLRIEVTDELLGALVRDRGNYFIASVAGAEWREAVRANGLKP